MSNNKAQPRWPKHHVPSTGKIVRKGFKPISLGIIKTKLAGWLFYKNYDTKGKSDLQIRCASEEEAKEKLKEV